MLFFISLDILSANPEQNILYENGDDGEEKCIISTEPGPMTGCYRGTFSTNCTRNVQDAFITMVNRLDNNLQRLHARWKEIKDEYKFILQKSVPSTADVFNQQSFLLDESLYIYKNAFEMEKYNKLLSLENDVGLLRGTLTNLKNELLILQNEEKK